MFESNIFLIRLEVELLDDLVGELRGGGSSSKISSAKKRGLVDVTDGLFDGVSVIGESHVAKHHRGGEDEGSGVGNVLTSNIETDVTGSGLEDGDLLSKVGTRDDTRSSDETASNVSDDVSVQVGGDEDVKLTRVGDKLHASVINNHLVELDVRVLLGDATSSIEEKTVGHLHDVGLVDGMDLLATVGLGVFESETSDLLRLFSSSNLQRLDNTRNSLVLQTRILSFDLLTNNDEIDTLVASLNGGQAADGDNLDSLLESTTDQQVTRHGTMSVLGVKRTLEEDTIASNTAADNAKPRLVENIEKWGARNIGKWGQIEKRASASIAKMRSGEIVKLGKNGGQYFLLASEVPFGFGHVFSHLRSLY